MKRPLATEVTDAEEAGIEPLAAELSWPCHNGQMCIGAAELGGSVPGQEAFLPAVTGGLEVAPGLAETAVDPGTVPWRKLPTCHGAPPALPPPWALTLSLTAQAPSPCRLPSPHPYFLLLLQPACAKRPTWRGVSP